MRSKHAYLIMAHNDFYTLDKLIRLIDDNRNDIYIHIDKKCNSISEDNVKKAVKYSRVFFVPRINVKWGGDSQVKAEILLLKNAIKEEYKYYHLLSGSDLPIKSQDYIHNFFEINNGKEFLGYYNFDDDRKKVKYYYFFQEIAPRKSNIKSFTNCIKNLLHIVFRIIDRVLIIGQKIINVDRIKNDNYIICRGSNWFSITDSLARDILKNSYKLYNMCKYSAYPDEIFIQTYVYNSKYKKNIFNINNEYESCMRHIDWKRGWPYTFKKDDFNELKSSDKIFARKFNSTVDKDIIDKIYLYFREDKENKE